MDKWSRGGNCSKCNQMEWKDLTVEEPRVNITRAAQLEITWTWQTPQLLGSSSSRASTNPWQKHTPKLSKTQSRTPDWLVEGATNLLPKKEETWIPKNYRPIACLPTTFKILTSVITDRLYSHLEKEAIMTPEQRGRKERLLWMQRSVDDQQCYLRKLQRRRRRTCQQLG